jgi:Flp pilus assembly protein TadD
VNHLNRQVAIRKVSWLQDTEDLAVMESERLAVEGYNAASREEYEDAVDYFTKAIRLIHNDHRFYGNRSFCFCQLGQYVK